MNPVNVRLGRRRKVITQTKSAIERRKMLEVANRISTERDWRAEIARAGQDVIDIDDCEEMYRE